MSNHENDEIEYLRSSFLMALRKELPISDWCDLLRHSKLTDKNKKIFPINKSSPECENFYKLIATYLLSTDQKKISMDIPESMIASEKEINKSKSFFQNYEKQLLKNLSYFPIWEHSIINGYEARKQISDEEALNNLISEISDPEITKNLFWLLSWSLRLCYITTHPQWDNWELSDSNGLTHITYFLYMFDQFKDRILFDKVLRRLFPGLCQETCTFDALMNQRLVDNCVRMIPWPHPLTEMELLDTWSCGIFPCAMMLRHIKMFDGVPMSGPMAWIHDWVHTIGCLSTSKIYISKKPFTKEQVAKNYESLIFWHNQYHDFVKRVVESAHSWTKKEKKMLFYLIHEYISPPIEKSMNILESDMESIKSLIESNTNKNNSKFKQIILTDSDYLAFAQKIRPIFINGTILPPFDCDSDSDVSLSYVPAFLEPKETALHLIFSNTRKGVEKLIPIILDVKRYKNKISADQRLYGMLINKNKHKKEDDIIDEIYGSRPMTDQGISFFTLATSHTDQEEAVITDIIMVNAEFYFSENQSKSMKKSSEASVNKRKRKRINEPNPEQEKED